MYTGKDFEIFGKVAASKYINSNTPLDKTITKLAEHYGLNSEQVTRVVEHANIETYLKLNKVAADKYIEFKVADPNKIYSALSFNMQKKASLFNDYSDLELDNSFYSVSNYEQDDIKRLDKSEKELLEKKAKFLKQAVNKKLEELDESFSRNINKLYKLVKQASLESGKFGIVKQAMTLAVPGEVTKLIIDVYKTKLKKEASGKIDFSEIEKITDMLNNEHPIVKELLKLSVLKDEYQTFIEFKKELEKKGVAGISRVLKGIAEILAGAGGISAKILKSVGKASKKTPWIVPTIGGAVAGIALGKAKGRQEISPTNIRTIKGKKYVQHAQNLRPL